MTTPITLRRFILCPKLTFHASTRAPGRYDVSNQHYSHASILKKPKVDPSKVPCLAQWKRDYTMETILLELRRYGGCISVRVTMADILLWQIHGFASAQETAAASRGLDLLKSPSRPACKCMRPVGLPALFRHLLLLQQICIIDHAFRSSVGILWSY